MVGKVINQTVRYLHVAQTGAGLAPELFTSPTTGEWDEYARHVLLVGELWKNLEENREHDLCLAQRHVAGSRPRLSKGARRPADPRLPTGSSSPSTSSLVASLALAHVPLRRLDLVLWGAHVHHAWTTYTALLL